MTTPKPISRIEIELLQNSISYEPRTGKFYWLISPNYNIKAGQQLINTNKGGYSRVCLKGKIYRLHLVAWLFYYGDWPKQQIDHKNGIKTDNRIGNLRLVTGSVNQQNKRMHRNGQPVGVYFDKKSNKWKAQAPANFLNRNASKQKYIGRFETVDEAAQAVIEYCNKEEKKE